MTTPEADGYHEAVTGPPMNPESAAERIADIRTLVRDLDDTPPGEMTPLYYQHGFNELDLAVRDLLHIIDSGLGPSD